MWRKPCHDVGNVSRLFERYGLEGHVWEHQEKNNTILFIESNSTIRLLQHPDSGVFASLLGAMLSV